MVIIIEKSYMNTVHRVYNLIEDKVLCNYNRDKGVIESRIPLPTSDIVAAYLITVFTRSNNIDIIKWKISFNDVILTREFKPHIETNINDNYTQTLFVYDISKIILKNNASIKIACNAKGYMYIDGVTLLTIIRYNDFNTHLLCEVNPYTIDGIKEKAYNVSPSFEINEVATHIGLITTVSDWLEIKIDDNIKRLNLPRGYNVVEVATRKSSMNAIQINSSSSKIRHIFSCIELRYVEYPRIIVENIQAEDSIIKFTVKNIGEGIGDSLELILMRYGVPIYRTQLPVLKPNEFLNYEINLNNITTKLTGFRPNNITLRIIWSKAYKLFEYDVPIRSLSIV